MFNSRQVVCYFSFLLSCLVFTGDLLAGCIKQQGFLLTQQPAASSQQSRSWLERKTCSFFL